MISWDERTLSQTLVYLDEPLKTNLKVYLRNEIQDYLLNSDYYAYRRACLDCDSGEMQDPCSNNTGIYAGWYWNNQNLIAERIYAIYKYAEMADDWALIGENWDFILQNMYTAIETNWDDEAGFFLWPE